MPNLSEPEVQARLTDGQISASILNGKGKMPGLQLPEPILSELVGLVRRMRVSNSLSRPAGSTDASLPGAVPATASPAPSPAKPVRAAPAPSR